MNQSTSLFHTDGTPCTPLLDLLELTGIEHEGTIASIRDQTQIWYQKGKFPYEIRDPDKIPLGKAELMPLFSKLGLQGAMSPLYPWEFRWRDYCLLLGATVPAVRRRLGFLRDMWKEPRSSVRFGTLVLLGSERLLSEKEQRELLRHDNEELPFDPQKINAGTFPKNEYEMMLAVYAQGTAFPWDTTDTSTVTVCTSGERANTADTIRVWIEQQNPEMGSCIAVSSQPHVGYQEWVVRNALPGNFIVEAIGPAAGESTPIAGYLNALAKWIFEEAKAHGV